MKHSRPDLFGLPEYYVSEIATEIDGPNVRIICGVNRDGEVTWLFSKIVRADLLIPALRQTLRNAEEAYNNAKMLEEDDHDGERTRGH